MTQQHTPETRQQKIRTRRPHIHVAAIGDQGCGIICSRWIDATLPLEDLNSKIRELVGMPSHGRANHIEIIDYVGFQGVQIANDEDIEAVSDAAAYVRKLAPLLGKLAERMGSLHRALRLMQINYVGEFGSFDSFVRSRVEDGLTFLALHLEEALIKANEDSDSFMVIECGPLAHIFDLKQSI